MNYTIPNNPLTGNPSTDVILRTDENGIETWIPTDPANSDYQAYLASQENN
jgi:hypothetical protein